MCIVVNSFVFHNIPFFADMDAKRKAMEGALVPAKRARNELVAVGDKENAIVQSVRVLYIEI